MEFDPKWLTDPQVFQVNRLPAHASYMVRGADGAPLPMGLSLSIWPDAEGLPVATLEVPASLEELPDEVTVVGGETTAHLK